LLQDLFLVISDFEELVGFYRVQRNVFGVCPKSGNIFRLSDCKVFLRGKPKRDWKDELDHESQRLDRIEERLGEREEELREVARKKGRKQALKAVKLLDPVFTPRKLNPDDAKVLFHPVDYIVFNGMKTASIRNLLLLDRSGTTKDRRVLQRSIERTISRGHYDCVTISIDEDGTVHERG
jgi:predicted Holliday junction resolvase-like endonuclease